MSVLREQQHRRRDGGSVGAGRRAHPEAQPAAVRELHRQLLAEHARSPRGAGLRAPFSAQVHHVNPVCGDEVLLRVDLVPDPQAGLLVRDVSYEARGCAISTASVSVLHDLTAGRALQESQAPRRALRELLTGAAGAPADEEVLGDGVALAGVLRHPARTRCVLLAWAAFDDAVACAGLV